MAENINIDDEMHQCIYERAIAIQFGLLLIHFPFYMILQRIEHGFITFR